MPVFSNFFLQKVKVFEYIKLNTQVESLAYIIKFWRFFQPLSKTHVNQQNDFVQDNFALSGKETTED